MDIIKDIPPELQNKERGQHKVSQINRDYRFRDEVLRRYNHKCAVCGCNLIYMLEAAHIQGVADGGSDDPQNGVCLCANHHKMYNKHYLELDFREYKYAIKPDNKSDLWFPTYKAKAKGQFAQQPINP